MRRIAASIGGGLAMVLAFGLAWSADEPFKESFEGREPYWVRGGSDAAPTELAHEMTNQTAHSGQQSERIHVRAEQGTYCHYVYSVGRIELIDDLQLKVWVKANRPGAQFSARLVLPKERDPNNLQQAVTLLLRGDVYDLPGRWSALTVPNPMRAARDQRLLLQTELMRPINLDGAYIDQLILNVYGGKGLNEVFIDDLEISPKPSKEFTPARPGKAKGATTSDPEKPAPRHAVVEINLDRLTIDKKPFFVRAIRHSDTPLKVLRDAGFNTLWLDFDTRDEVIEEAINRGFWLAPHIPVLEDNERVSIPDGLTRELKRFKYKDAVLFWHTGSGLTAEYAATVGQAAKLLRSDPECDRPVAGDIWDGFKPYSRHLDVIGVHRWPLGTSLELDRYRVWLAQRTRLGEPGKYEMAWIQTHVPESHLQLVHGAAGRREFEQPLGPHPEQIRLMTYLAISAGYKGIGYWSDRFLANSHHGKGRLLQLGLLNQELEMLEPMLASAKVVDWIDTEHKEVKAAVLRYDGGMIVLPIWLGPGAQYVPGQYATNHLTLLIPGAPEDAQIWEISPGRVTTLAMQHVKPSAGGLKVTISEFGLTAALLITPDVRLIGELQQLAKAGCKKAAQWSYDLALEELTKVERINEQLERIGQAQPDGQKLLDECRRRLNLAREAWAKGTLADYRETYAESQRALRPLRILMRAHWEQAIKVIDHPVSSPYAVSFYTLPKHWEFVDEIRGCKPAENQLPTGDFEDPKPEASAAWAVKQEKLDAVSLHASRSPEEPKEGKFALKLEVKPEDPARPPAALQRTFLAATSPGVRLHPGSIVRISGWVRIPQPIQASADGVMLFDSIGGEPFAIRLTEATPWRKFTVYRRVPASGSVSVTLALTGIGVAYFDDVRVEPMFPNRK